jgi:poly(3-hydroxybutyrate) depolymerase
MYSRIMFCLLMMIGLTVSAQTINLRGVVSNKMGRPLGNATVTLIGKGLMDTSATTTGAYSITKTTSIQPAVFTMQTEKISLNGGILKLNLTKPSSVKIEVFDVKGTLLIKQFKQKAAAGEYSWNISNSTRASNMLIIKISIGKQVISFSYLQLGNGKYITKYSTPILGNSEKAALAAASVDSLKATANGYTTKTIAVSSYDSTVNIFLDSLPGPSIGCGKTFATLKTGTYTITSAGLSRKYIISLPANYDRNHPYRLIFAMHCMGASASQDSSEKFYQLKRYADSTKDYCIFVAPQGYTDNMPWRTGDNKDHIFVDDMLHMFKDTLCIDTTRIFSCGFSFGAMFTYSLSTNHQKQFRAVACFAPANYNIYLPTNAHLPIAYMGTTGMGDNTCPFINPNASTTQGGKFCAIGHATDNGATNATTVTVTTTKAGSKTHVCYQFQGVNIDYPVNVWTFDGGHQCYVVEGTSGTDNMTKSWITAETWKFFTQF